MIDISEFRGEIPKISAKLLPVNYAASAMNCDLSSGNLQPISGVSAIQDVEANTSTIHKMNTSFLQWAAFVNIAKALVADSGNRIVFTGDGYPKETNADLALDSSPYPTATRRLGIPAPTNALIVSPTGTAGTEIIQSSSYVYTIVGKWEDGSEVESAPSNPTAVFEVYEGIVPRLTDFMDSMAPGVYTTHFRIYRLNSGNSGAEYQYVDEITIITDTYDDIITDDDLGEVLPSTEWLAPEETLSGIIPTSHGLVFGFVGNTIYPSEIFIPYAFPSSYSLVTESDIVGGGFTGSLVVVLTETVPYMLIGQDPAMLSLKRLNYQQACVSARSIVNIPGGVAYASNDGLFVIDEAGLGVLLTKKVFTKEQWKALNPENIFGFYYKNSYYGFFSGTPNGFIFDLETAEYKPVTLLQNIYGGEYSSDTDLLYLIQTKAAIREVVSWGTGVNLDYSWTSKIFTSTLLDYYTAGILQGTFSESVVLSFYADGVLVDTKTVGNDGLFTIKGMKGNSFQIKIVGKAIIDRVIIGRSGMEVVGRS